MRIFFGHFSLLRTITFVRLDHLSTSSHLCLKSPFYNKLIISARKTEVKLYVKIGNYISRRNRSKAVGNQAKVEDTYHTLQDYICFRIIILINYTRTVDQEDPLCECNVLPNFRLSWDRSHLANLIPKEGKKVSSPTKSKWMWWSEIS